MKTSRSFAQLVAIVSIIFFGTHHRLSATEHPMYSAEITISSHGSKLPAIFYGAFGKGPHPTAILLHGYPGNEKNLDIAQGMRSAGWNVIFFHYRGAWGAEGEFSFTRAEDDVSVVTQFLQQKEVFQQYRIDPNRISYIGHSMGGHMAIAGMLKHPEVKCAVAYDNANISQTFYLADKESRKLWRSYTDTLYMLKGWTSYKLDEELKQQSNRLNLLNKAKKVGTRPILFVPADSKVIPIAQIDELVSEMQKVPGNRVHYKLVKDDHSFNNSRDKLLTITREFLNSNCR